MSEVRYVWETSKPRRVMHIGSITRMGTPLFLPLCNTPVVPNRSINAPFGLGRKVCKKCRAIMQTSGLVKEQI